MVELYLEDVLENIMENPIDWVAINGYRRFDGIKSIKKNIKIKGFGMSGYWFVFHDFHWFELTINDISMPLKLSSKRKLYKIIEEWAKHVPAAHLLGDIALIKKDDEPNKIKLVT